MEKTPRPSFSVLVWIRIDQNYTDQKSTDFAAIAADKAWDGGQVVDFLSRQNSGRSLDSGLLPGWALAVQPDGAWCWNLADGTERLDYLPTPQRQSVADGRWHQLAFSVDAEANEARLYRDGLNVACYNLAGLKNWHSGRPPLPGGLGDQVRDLRVMDGVVAPTAVVRDWCDRGNADPAPPQQTPRQLRLMAWNIWNGGREDGVDLGVQRTAAVIAEARADLVAMQETYGSGPIIADALGFYFYRRSSNLSVLSRFPIAASHDIWDDPFRLGGVTLDLGDNAQLRLFSLWIHYLPDFCNDVQQDGVTAAQLIAAEEKTRGAEIRGILNALQPFIQEADAVPLVVAGDFNSPSHLDWTPATRSVHQGLDVAWPVSRRMQEAGFTDAYRQVHPDPLTHPGRTWTPRSPQAWQDRIDYVYYQGCGLTCHKATVLDTHPQRWPSDHAAVLTTFHLD